MMWLLLFVLTAVVVMLPMVPAIVEWARPSDVVPLHIDSEDALDPPFLARSFAARLATAVAAGQQTLGRSSIAVVPPHGAWPLDAAEKSAGLSRRVWHAAGDVDLPAGTSFLAEVATQGGMRTAERGIYRALWAEGRLRVASAGTVLRWAHGQEVDIGGGCRLAGRISADERLTLHGRAAFSLLHAPTVHFAAPSGALPTAAPAGPGLFSAGLPPPVVWDAIASRGTCDEALEVDADRSWCGDLVCRDDLTLGTGCSAHGSIKARGDIVTDDRCRITGSLIAEGRIELGERCAVRGSVVSETAIVIGAGCRIGAPDHPATVAAPQIEVAPGVIVHGTLWAGESGRAQRAALPAPAAVASPAAVRPDLLPVAPRLTGPTAATTQRAAA